MKHHIDEFILNDIDTTKGIKGRSITYIAISILVLFIIIIISRSVFAPTKEPINQPSKPDAIVKEKVIKQDKPIKNNKSEVKKPITKNMYYVQVATYKKSPSQVVLNHITASGFQYTIGEYQKTGTKRLLIGPYTTKEAAKSDLKTIKDRIAKDAYIIKQR